MTGLPGRCANCGARYTSQQVANTCIMSHVLTDGGTDEGETYRDPCPKCGARLLGISKDEYIQHLRRNGETLAAKIEDEMIISEDDQ